MTDKEQIQNLTDGNYYLVPEGNYGKAEIWAIHNEYFLYSIPYGGGEPAFEGVFKNDFYYKLLDMSKELTEAKELNRQAAEKIKEYELLEEARRRGFVKGVRIKSIYSEKIFTLDGEPSLSWNRNLFYGNRVIYDAIKKQWAEIIPEEEKKEKCPDCGLNKGCPYCFCESKIKPEKSLHDQIREGGWNKVWELAGNEFDFQTIHSRPLAAKMVEKTVNYIKLLALSKVLNEGKEREPVTYTVCWLEGELRIHQTSSYREPIEFYNYLDRDFALEFAEKEWKLFYSSK